MRKGETRYKKAPLKRITIGYFLLSCEISTKMEMTQKTKAHRVYRTERRIKAISQLCNRRNVKSHFQFYALLLADPFDQSACLQFTKLYENYFTIHEILYTRRYLNREIVSKCEAIKHFAFTHLYSFFYVYNIPYRNAAIREIFNAVFKADESLNKHSKF